MVGILLAFDGNNCARNLRYLGHHTKQFALELNEVQHALHLSAQGQPNDCIPNFAPSCLKVATVKNPLKRLFREGIHIQKCDCLIGGVRSSSGHNHLFAKKGTATNDLTSVPPSCQSFLHDNHLREEFMKPQNMLSAGIHSRLKAHGKGCDESLVLGVILDIEKGNMANPGFMQENCNASTKLWRHLTKQIAVELSAQLLLAMTKVIAQVLPKLSRKLVLLRVHVQVI